MGLPHPPSRARLLLVVVAAALLGAAGPSQALLRRLVAQSALAQADKIDPRWPAQQRDCAGLVRFAYGAAFRALQPQRIAAGLWRDRDDRPTAFADAETLLAVNFASLGRDARARAQLASGDLVAFRQDGGSPDPAYHLMLVLQPPDPAHGQTRVVYHTGEKPGEVRLGVLDELERDAPAEWRPVAQNPSFLGFFRFKEWMQ